MNNGTGSYQFDGIIAEKRVYNAGIYLPLHKDVYPKFSLLLQGSLIETTSHGRADIDSPGLIVKPNSVLHEDIFGRTGATILSVIFLNEQTVPSILQNWEYVKHPYVSVLGIRLWAQLKKISKEKDLKTLLVDFQKELEALLCNKRKYNKKIEQGEKLLHELETTIGNVNEVALELSLHRVYFSRAFKKYYNITPAEFAKCSRLLKAVFLLMHSKSSLAAIAYDAGFVDQSHFHRTLKKRIGCTPLELRNLLKA